MGCGVVNCESTVGRSITLIVVVAVLLSVSVSFRTIEIALSVVSTDVESK